MKIAIILGTRPEIIKMSPIIRACQQENINFFILHTNQHYSQDMDQVFFDELRIPQPEYNIQVHDLDHNVMVGQMLIGIDPILKQERPEWVLVEGDTNTVLAGAIAATKLGFKLGHVEAGLRSYDRTMPEELNRIVTDHLSDLLFCPTDHSAQIATGEGIPRDKIVVTGNTIVDATLQNLKLADNAPLPVNLPSKYFLLTLHRPSNVDDQDSLSTIINALEQVSNKYDTPIIFPAHPRTTGKLKQFSIQPNANKIKFLDPVSYLTMLRLEQGAELILTDSGGVQEEACILKIPCVTLRDNTERPETVEVGANILAGTSSKTILSAVGKTLSLQKKWNNPFGSGDSASQILRALN